LHIIFKKACVLESRSMIQL